MTPFAVFTARTLAAGAGWLCGPKWQCMWLWVVSGLNAHNDNNNDNYGCQSCRSCQNLKWRSHSSLWFVLSFQKSKKKIGDSNNNEALAPLKSMTKMEMEKKMRVSSRSLTGLNAIFTSFGAGLWLWNWCERISHSDWNMLVCAMRCDEITEPSYDGSVMRRIFLRCRCGITEPKDERTHIAHRTAKRRRNEKLNDIDLAAGENAKWRVSASMRFCVWRIVGKS